MDIQENILNVSKNAPQHPETFFMDDLMDDLYNYVTQELKNKGKPNVDVELCKLTSIEKCLVHTDRALLRQIFVYMLDNAVKSTNVGCIFFGYHTSIMSVINNINFFVDDTGNGIDNEAVVNFSIAQVLIQQLGGEMEVRPSNDAGVSVNFNIVCHPCEFFEN